MRTKHLRKCKHKLTMRPRKGYLIADKLTKELSFLLVAGRTEPAGLTTERQEHFVTTALTSNSSKSTTQVSTFQKLPQDLLYNWA